MISRKAKFNRQQNEVCVWSFSTGSLEKAAVKVRNYKDKILVKDLLTAVARELRIHQDNTELFAIFEGPLLNPFRKLEGNNELHLSYQKTLSIQKWSFDVEKERRAVKSDEAALKLLRHQALSEIQAGRMNPSHEDMEKLEDFSNNAFIVDRQFMNVIYSLKDYGSVFVENCEVITELTLHPQVSIGKGETVTLQTNLKGLTVKTGKQ